MDALSFDDIDPDTLYPGPAVDRLFGISNITRGRWEKAGHLVSRRPGGPRSRPRYLGADLLAARDRRAK